MFILLSKIQWYIRTQLLYMQCYTLTSFMKNKLNAIVDAQHTLLHDEWISYQKNLLLSAWMEFLKPHDLVTLL